LLIKLNKDQEKILYVLTFVAIGLGILFLRTYLMLILFSAIMAVLFGPIYLYFIRKGRSKGTASFYTFVASLLIVLIPLIFVIMITGLQISSLISSIESQNYTYTYNNILNQIVEIVNNFLANVGVETTITVDSVTNSISSALSSISTSLLERVVGAFSGFFNLITASIIYIYVFLSMLKHQDKIKDLLKKLNPLGDEVSSLYMDRANAMTKATVRGQFIIAFMQGSESAVVLALVGMQDLFFFYLLLLTVMSVIPLGAGIITIPLGVIMILTGNIWQGVVVILNHLLIVTNIDNVMRPRLVPKSARLDPALMILAVFSGIALFGFLGIVIGPIIMILITTTLQIYQEVFYKKESIDRTKDTKTKRFSRISGITKRATDKITSIVD
jgi:predicted PurR-regulated permease PerM